MGDKKKKTSKKKNNNKKEELEKTKKYKMKKTKNKHPKLKKFLKIFLILFAILAIIGAGAIAGIFLGLFGNDLSLSDEDMNTLIKFSNSHVVDSAGSTIAVLTGDENRKIITTAEMTDYLPKAFVAIEDKRFYEHSGVDIKRTAAATVSFIFNRGSSSFGGSSITQQLIKNITEEKDTKALAGVIRKVKEISRAYELERHLSKDQILELYLNIIYLGGGSKNICGVEVASQYYFNKTAKELDLAECAFLAGINHSPNAYDPYDEEDHTEKIKKRALTVLSEMKTQGMISSEEEYNVAVQKVNNGYTFVKGNLQTNSYSYHTAALINQLVSDIAEEKGWDKEAAKLYIYGGGLTIYSTQNTAIQNQMEEEFLKESYIKKSKIVEGATTQAAMVVIDNSTGYVVGTVGGLGSNVNALGLNRALSPRQTGSAMKPLAVILPGICNNVITAGSVFYDAPTTFNGRPIKNSTKYLKLDSVAHAIGNSSNITATKIMTVLGTKNSLDFMINKLKISTLVTAADNPAHNDEGISTALGGITNGVSTLEMAAAYATIANDGTYIEPTFYTKVIDSEGNTIYEVEQYKEKVFSEQDAYVVKQILLEPVTGAHSTASYCAISGMDVCAKTGTTSDDADRWLCGFTKYYSAATWFGYDENRETVPYFSRNPAGSIFSNVMKGIHTDKQKVRFTKPSGIVLGKVCLDSGLIATDACTRTQSVPYKNGTVPTQCNSHTKLMICTETGKIANEYCVNKEEKTYLQKPLTEQTTAWVTKYDEGVFYDIPTEVCNIHTKKQQTVVNVVGKKEAEAKTALTALNIIVKEEYAEDKEKDNGIVLKQSIVAGTLVDEGTTITITVNKKSTPTVTTTAKPTATTKPTSSPTAKPTSNPTAKPTAEAKPTATIVPTTKPSETP
ncbi:MAG: transglycosylase domain-containing protein [Clostridia bacterium]|nr:transglycosylase domain-containing protein [Clostridia bacterium]